MKLRPEDVVEIKTRHSANAGLLHRFFDETATRWPQNVAIELPPGEGRSSRSCTTYADLLHKANALAQSLNPYVTGECVVGILLPRTTGLLYASQLASLKAGAAYTCIDSAFPDERIRELLVDAAVAVVLTDAAGLRRLQAMGAVAPHIIEVHEAIAKTLHSIARGTEEESPAWLTPSHLAYIIYTSGTTGRPKGVMIEHRSISNLVSSDLEAFELTAADRVAQSSSAAYDSSVEETWLALAVGATVVVMDENASRLGPDLIPWLRRERITVFCPPPTLLRATGCQDPERELPDLRLLYVGGEPLPRDVADLWSRGRKLINGYGPTECTVTCLRDRIEVGQPITIGRVVAGVDAWVMDDKFARVQDGEVGELCIGGVGLARGYWNRAELTSEKFIEHPQCGRIYRTGDLVHRDGDGRFFYHGRIDSQVKLRGYRIELGEIESRLVTCAGVREAACKVQDNEGHVTLLAFIVPRDSAQLPSTQTLRAWLAVTLPDYMIPAQFRFLPELPTRVSGKLNRSALPSIEISPQPTGVSPRDPMDPVQEKVEVAFRKALKLSQPAAVDANFFTDLGGDSLSAAGVITILREDPITELLAVRDLYEAPTIVRLAQRVTLASSPNVRTAITRPRLRNPLFATVIQTIWLLKGLAITALVAYGLTFYVAPSLSESLGLTTLILLGPPLFLLGVATYLPLSLAFAVLTKRVLIGRYKPIRAEVWGTFYLRHWIVQRAVHLVPWWIIEGTELQVVALRALGARIGKRVHLHRGVNLTQGGWDLLEIGDDVTLAQDATLQLVELDSGHLIIDAIHIGSACTLGIQSCVGGNTCLEREAYLAARSSLPRGSRVPSGERWDGIPARSVGSAPCTPLLTPNQQVLSPLNAGLLLIACRLALVAALAIPTQVFTMILSRAYDLSESNVAAWCLEPSFSIHLFLATTAIAVVPMPLIVLLEALACRFMGRIPAGVSSRWSPGYIRMWLKAGLVDSGSRWLYGTLFWPMWLRLAGMKVGKGCELSSLIDTLPESVDIGANTFCADGIYIGGPCIHRGTVTVSLVRLGENTFVGNGAILSGGQYLPAGVLVGICTVAADAPMREGTNWFGHPPFELPRREIIASDRNLTHNPSALRFAVRIFWEALRFSLPLGGALVIQVWFVLLTQAHELLSFPVFLALAVPLLSLVATSLPVVMILLIKWLLLGRVRPGVHPLWSSWASRWDFVCLAWSLYAAEAVSTLNGTLYLNALIRLMGVKVGRGVILGHGVMQDLPDPDMLVFEDEATIDCLFQAHTFEDRMLKLDRIIIRKQASVGRHAVLLYGAEIGAGTRVAPNSVVMKHERLLPHHNYAGFPTRPTEKDAW